jgi:hypothetical protein
MATDFNTFLQHFIGQAQVPAPPPVQPVPSAVAPPQPLPPYQPPQQLVNPIQQAASGLPPHIVEMVTRAALQTVQQAQGQQQRPAPPPPQGAPQDQVRQGFTPQPFATASTQPTAPAGPPVPSDQETSEAYVPIIPPNSNDAILVPVEFSQALPPGYTIAADQVITDPAAITAMRSANRTLDTQPPEVQGAFRTELDARLSGVRAIEASEPELPVDAPVTYSPAALTDEQAQQRLEQAKPDPNVVSIPVADVVAMDPVRGGLIAQSGAKTYRTDQMPVVDPKTGQVTLVTEDEAVVAQDMYVPVEWFINPDDNETREFVANLKASGIDSIRQSDIPWIYTPNPNDPTKLAVLPEREREGVRNPAVPLPDLSTDYIRRNGGPEGPAIANQLEDKGIYGVPDGKMVVRNTETRELKIVDANEKAPEGTEFLYWGGQRSELTEDYNGPLFPGATLGEKVKNVASTPFLAIPEPVQNWLGRPRQWTCRPSAMRPTTWQQEISCPRK